ncbi:lipid IV(A) 3-deoxy-D-manno-octulosonic acid transferase [Rickettsia endosymbiont of Culicoides newsteadi]|uniref:lipid IV(A) 3-deoxy-D-manno-octulosonic acid transferase n=1 Tax=Rickettsia endosymbiont of Culicoides newsteadi TaxID=1961830 RepID=UPI000B9BE1A0|nr:lipid IV(A) 3-deoxy-D-manno-octulosonic acid transferase [Rickettsia endosymbiont of Culicoides newsteadi]OZG31513.1 3-deoxy-D-manno-octulosonic acid transferase [Rickettsia endosymbiont of Culicoides newsteadi]
MIYLYHILSFLFLPLYVLLLVLRVIVGKEDIKRIGERFAIGHTHTIINSGGLGSRNDGVTPISNRRATSDDVPNFSSIDYKRNETLVWIHAASVGESMIALTLVENINDLWLKRTMPKTTLKFLVTSGTKSSAKILQQKLPVNAVHQLIPIDNIIFVKKFFRNWQPTLGIFVESELWPCLISEGKKHCKLLLLNARISDKSFASWKKISSFFREITSNFSEIIVQSNIDYEKFMQLGMSNINNLGNIKFANKKLPVNEQELTILAQYMSAKRIIVFASTHLEDETVLLNIIKPIKQRYPNCYFILIPRHPERKNDIGKACTQLNLTYSIKSEQNIPILTDDLYIVDKFGELGLFFSISYISFVGGSFKQGGHNVLEPAYFANYIIFGPDMSNFANIANEMLANKAATQIQNESDLLNKMEYLLSETGIEEAKIYQTNALEFVNKNQQILGNYLAIIEKYLLVGVNN